jgi:hypothetical protein
MLFSAHIIKLMNAPILLLVLVTIGTIIYLVCLIQKQQTTRIMGSVAQTATEVPPETKQAPTNVGENTWFVPSDAGIRRNYNFGSERQGTGVAASVPRATIDYHLDAAELAEPTENILPMDQLVEDELVNAFDGAIEELVETVTDNTPNDWLNEQCSKIREGSLLMPSYRYNQAESDDTAAKWKARATPSVIPASVAKRLGEYHDKPNQDIFHRMEQMRLSMAKDLGSKMGPGLKKITPDTSSGGPV